MKIKHEKIAKHTMEQIAKRDGKTVAQVRSDISEALEVGRNSPDYNVQAYWRNIPSKGEKPTPEEVILYLAGQL